MQVPTRAERAMRSLSRKVVPPGDAELLAFFVNGRDDAAFAELVLRYGPLVMGLARRYAAMADCDDVFQVTFALLARDAGKIRQRDNLAGWLYRTACRTAKKAARRKKPARLETDRADAKAADPAMAAGWRELAVIIDAELLRLPEELRTPLIVCFLQGQTQEEAARRLNWSFGTFRRRLDRGRELLRLRLEKRGLAPMFLAAAALPPSIALAEVPPALSIVVSQFAAGGTLSATAVSLISSTAVSMKVITLATVCTLGLGLTAFYANSAPPDKPKPFYAEVLKDAPKSAEPKAAEPRRDAFGDPLPPDVLQKFGTARLTHPDGIESMVLSADGKMIVSLGITGICFWEADTGRLIWSRKLHSLPHAICASRTLACAPDGKTFYAASSGSLDIHEQDSEIAHNLPVELHKFVQTVHFSKTGRVAVGSEAGVTVFDSPGGKLLLTIPNSLPDGKESLNSHGLAEMSPDGKTVIVNADEPYDTIRLCSVDTGADIATIKQAAPTIRVAFSPDGKEFAVALADATLNFYDSTTREKLHTWKLPIKDEDFSGATAFAFSPDGRTVAVGGGGGSVHLYEAATGKELHLLTNRQWLVREVAFSPDGATLYSAGNDGSIRRWDVGTGKPKPLAGERIEGDLARSPDGRTVAVGVEGNRIAFLDAATAEGRGSIETENCDNLAFSKDGRLLAAAGWHGVEIWDWQKGKRLRILTWSDKADRGDKICKLEFGPDGKTLAAAIWKRSQAYVWNLEAGGSPLALGHAAIHGLSYSPDSKTLATVGVTWSLKLWDLSIGKLRVEAATPKARGKASRLDSRLVSCAHSPDGRTIAAGALGGAVYLCDATTLQIRNILNDKDDENLDYCNAGDLSFSPSGATLAVAYRSRVATWDCLTWQEIQQSGGFGRQPERVHYGPGGSTLLTFGRDNVGLLWDTRPKTMPEIGDALWAGLHSSDAKIAYAAMWAVMAKPKEAVDYLAKKLPPAKVEFDRAKVLKQIGELNSDSFRIREAAESALRTTGTLAIPLMKETKAVSAEQKSRLEKLIKAGEVRKTDLSEENLGILRAVQAIEQAGGPEAKSVMKAWSEGTAGLPLTVWAGEALARMP